MGWSSVRKVLQKQTHDFLSHRHGTLIIVCGLILITVSAFQFGEVALEWSTEKYAAVFNSFSDNIAGRSYRTRLCLPVPIDVVYTWVNGSDPKLISELRRQKMMMEQELNETSTVKHFGECTFAHCIKAKSLVLEPPIPGDITLIHLGFLYPSFKAATGMQLMVNPASKNANVSLVSFETQEQVDLALNTTIFVNSKNISIRQVYYTSDWTLPNAVILADTITMTGFPHTMEREQLYDLIPIKYQKSITKFELHQDKGVVLMVLSSADEVDALIKEQNITIENKEPSLSTANLVWDLTDYTLSEDVSANRFEDNEELRYSLRSIEQYAPWVRHVYIVTNGQLPGWLNLDSSRLTVVPHKDIFPNRTHLPTFSSPSIESHLHRIPGLSDKFIYLNDDVMFGKEVWPDDFYTHSRGQKVYLTWPVPNCQEGCPSSWILDGYCDKACNNSECEWDGGDCKGDSGSQGFGGDFGAGGAAMGDGHTTDSLYCNTGCANSWIADRYCDSACNVYPCGFDAGDCGTQAYRRLQGTTLDRNITRYTLPQGEVIYYFNLTSLLGENGTIHEAHYNESKIVRSVAVALKFHVITLVFYGNMSLDSVELHLEGKDASSKVFEMNITVTADTRILPKTTPKPVEFDLVANTSMNDTKPRVQFVFQEYRPEERLPRAESFTFDQGAMDRSANLSLYELPEKIQEPWTELLQAYQAGDLTEQGFIHHQGLLWGELVHLLKLEGKELVKISMPSNNGTIKTDDLGGGEGHDLKQREDEARGDIVKQNDVPSLHNVDSDVRDRSKADIGAGDRRVELGVGDSDYKNKDSVKEYLHNMSSKVRSSRQVLAPGENMENVVNMDNILIDKRQVPVQANEEIVHKLDVDNVDRVAVNINRDNQGDPDVPGEDKFRSRKLNSVVGGNDLMIDSEDVGFLPWEKQGVFKDVQEKRNAITVRESYQVAPLKGRKLLDTFGDSLRHVNKLYNKEFGYVARKVPAHMPHMVDKNIMAELQNRFPKEWDVTSSHKVRSSDDMQFSFSYYYFLMSEPDALTVRDVFTEMDFDKSGVLSDREIRTMATRLFEPPLDLQTLTSLELTMKNCSQHAPVDLWSRTYTQEKYYEKDMPQVTLHLIENCTPVIRLFEKAYKARTKYKHEIIGDEEVAFKMIRTNVSQVVGQLDDIRRHPKKFICLNDNIVHSQDSAKTVKAVLVDFYESMYPIPSSFELPREYKNRFLHLDELNDWRKYRDWLKLWTQVALVFLILFTIASFFSDKIEALQKKYLGRRRTSTAKDEDSLAPQRPLQHV